MKYRFIVTYQATDSETTATRTCFPLHGDDLSISIDRAEGEWYYTRNLDGKLVFTGDDYAWIMACEFDGTFTLNIKESHDNGATFYDYFTGTFSRASLEIDEDNHTATLNGLKEGITDLIKNGKKEEYDLMKLIPDSEAKTVQGQVPPALAMVDWINSSIPNSNVYCGGPSISGGVDGAWRINGNAGSDSSWKLIAVHAEAKVTMRDAASPANGIYSDNNNQPMLYQSHSSSGGTVTGPIGSLRNNNWYWLSFSLGIYQRSGDRLAFYVTTEIYDNNGIAVPGTLGIKEITEMAASDFEGYLSPLEVTITADTPFAYEKIDIRLHYIRAALLTQSAGSQPNVLNTGDYYKKMSPFNGTGLTVYISRRTTEQPNGHRLVPGTDEYGGIPQYFAPPDDIGEWIALAEDNWNYASMWYKITPSIPNGLLDPARVGTFSWAHCWNIGTCIRYLLKRITNDEVVFAETTDYSQFLYGNPNPVEGHEPFQWLVTQKSNVMRPAAGGASRCIVRLDWFFELLRNAFNCYYWFEKRNDGRYDFRIEHVEYFRRGGAYQGDLADQLDLTRLKPYRNFLRNGQPAKRYSDQTNRYTFDLDNMVEKYTYSWQGDGGGDDFKGNPMYFKAGWIEKGSSEDHQVDNIFADLGWLMLNAGTETASSKNYDGLFIFGGYQPALTDEFKENEPPTAATIDIPIPFLGDSYDLWLTIPSGYQVKLQGITSGGIVDIRTYTGTGAMQLISITDYTLIPGVSEYRLNFGTDYTDVIIHRIHARSGNVFYVPNVRNLLRTNIVNYLQNGCLAWPWLQCEYLHYDIPAAKWTYLKDDYTDGQTIVWETDGTIKMVKKQTLAVVPVPDASTEEAIVDIMGVKTGLGTGIIDNAKINLSSRNAEMTIIYDINPQNQ